jgi:hypothetical protein
VTVFLAKQKLEGMDFSSVHESLSLVVAFISPQLAVMVAFLFRTPKTRQLKLVEAEPALTKTAIGLSLLYHGAFVISLVLGVLFEFFYPGQGIDLNTTAMVQVMGFFAVLGIAPVAYLFSSATPNE